MEQLYPVNADKSSRFTTYLSIAYSVVTATGKSDNTVSYIHFSPSLYIGTRLTCMLRNNAVVLLQ